MHCVARRQLAARRLRRRRLEKFKEIRHVKILLVDAADRREHRLKRLLPLPEGDDVEREISERDATGRGRKPHEGVGCVEGDGREKRQSLSKRASDGHLPVFFEECNAESAVAREKRRTEAEELHLLRVFVVCEHMFEVRESPPLLRPSIAHLKREPGSVHLRGRSRDRCCQKHQDDPWAEPNEQGRVGKKRHHALRKTEALAHELQRPRRRFAPRPCHLVVEFRVFERRQIEADGLFEDRYVDVDTQAKPKDLADERQPALYDCLRRDQPEFDEHPAERVVRISRDDRVDDPLAGPRCGWRDQGSRGRHRSKR